MKKQKEKRVRCRYRTPVPHRSLDAKSNHEKSHSLTYSGKGSFFSFSRSSSSVYSLDALANTNHSDSIRSFPSLISAGERGISSVTSSWSLQNRMRSGTAISAPGLRKGRWFAATVRPETASIRPSLVRGLGEVSVRLHRCPSRSGREARCCWRCWSPRVCRRRDRPGFGRCFVTRSASWHLDWTPRDVPVVSGGLMCRLEKGRSSSAAQELEMVHRVSRSRTRLGAAEW